MIIRASTLARSVLSLGVLVSLGCPGDSVAPSTPAIAITASSGAVTLNQGATQTVSITVNRTNFTEPVSLVIEGLPAGVTGAFSPASLPDGTATSTLTLTSTTTATPGAATLTVRATGTGIKEQTATIALTVNVTGTYTLGVSPTSVALVQGASGSATVNITRNAGFAGTVALAVTGAPSGLTATLNPTSATGNSSALTLAASSSATVGTHMLTVAGTTVGLANQTTTLSVQISAPSATTSLTFNLCNDQPMWVAIQNDGESWKRITPTTGSTYTFDATSKFGFAMVSANQGPSGGFHSFILFTTVADIQPFSGLTCGADQGSKTLTGSVSGLTGTQEAVISTLFHENVATASQPGFTFTTLPDRALDFVGVRYPSSAGRASPDRVIIRRNVTQTSGALPAFDFGSGEAGTLGSHQLTVTGAEAGENVSWFQHLRTMGDLDQRIAWQQSMSGTTATIPAVNSAQRISTDMHVLEVSGTRTSGGVMLNRGAFNFYKDAAAKTVTLGAALAAPTISVAAAAPYVRMRMQLPSQSDYNKEVQVFYEQSAVNREVSVQATTGYFGTLPTTWDLVIPDFTGVTGFDSNWMLKTGQPTNTDVWASNSRFIAEMLPNDGESFLFAERIMVVQTFVGSVVAREVSKEVPRARRLLRPAVRK